MEYEQHEWDNIPKIVPNMFEYQNKYLKGFAENIEHLNGMDSAKSVRIYLDKQLEVIID